MNCANHPDRERVAFCQNCGKPICQECSRTVGSAVFCEPCLAARLAGTPTPGGYAPYGGVNSESVNYVVDSVVPPPRAPGAPSPALATLLGFIPGVGAMYNGQYAKGVVHLIVFAILVSLASDVNGIFGLFVAGWVVYQAIEANHTARARLAGTPLPNPFGLNDLGERFGFGRAWPAAAPYAPDAATAEAGAAGSATGTYAGAGAYTPPAAAPYPPYTPPVSSWGAPADSYNSYAVPPVPPVPPYGAPFADAYTNSNPVPRNRFPVGAIWLIGLGLFFLIGNSGIFHGFPLRHVTPFLLIGLGVWLFVRKMTETGTSLQDDGTPMYRIRVFRALRGSVWVTLVGIIFFLAEFNILSWGHSWPLFIIVAGLMTILERAAHSNAGPTPYPYQQQPASAAPGASSASATPSTSIVPSSTNDQEGR